ncbi:hypothetical protein HOLleu_30948 [Holothuria leucospilota]|uniref:Uncharacterized protein n=1 Tax=Holothuria leucospilota TaxID=206669 RepID=A0A9Q1H0Z6_HOLLE|nr:hypothetical protein HOLleu_30948 [Holothuria leucospilota]
MKLVESFEGIAASCGRTDYIISSSPYSKNKGKFPFPGEGSFWKRRPNRNNGFVKNCWRFMFVDCSEVNGSRLQLTQLFVR